ncbi:MAG: DUF2141 domain-containing protein [Crocinitomicaceae bacterium]|nr:DUF2141 domain-containing protein [Crocinitomicaceae bacterium]
MLNSRFIAIGAFFLGLVLFTSVNKSVALKLAKGRTFIVTVHIGPIRNTDGQIQLQIYKDQASYKKETPWKFFLLSKKLIKDGIITYKVTGLEPGTYGFALLDDENKDTKMNYGFFLPKEGYGFSDFLHTSYTSRPKFNDFKFELNSHKTVSMEIRYM